MSMTGLRGLMARFFGGGRSEPSETRDSIERAAGVAPAERRPADGPGHAGVGETRPDRPGS